MFGHQTLSEATEGEVKNIVFIELKPSPLFVALNVSSAKVHPRVEHMDAGEHMITWLREVK